MPGKDEKSGAAKPGWGEVVGLLLLVAAVVLIMRPQGPSAGEMPVPKGTALPPLMAEGWLNVDGAASAGRIPSVDSLRGRVVVVDCWATWCVPCRASMPKLARLYAQYRPLGVEFIGLTAEGEGDRAQIERFLSSVPGADWPVGYGSAPTLDLLGIAYLPTLVVFDPEGRAVWSGISTDDLPAVLDQALAGE